MSIITLIIPVLIKLFDLYLEKVAKDKEARKQFLELIDTLGKKGIVSAKLRKTYYEKRMKLESENTLREV